MKVQDLNLFERFVQLAAARTGRELNLTALAEDLGVSRPTARHWLDALQTGYIVTLVPPHHANFRKRLRKRPKLHFVDTGLACYLLGIRNAKDLELHPQRGAIFESFVVREVQKAFLNRRETPAIFHWKNKIGHEIDILLDLGARLLPIEVKSGSLPFLHRRVLQISFPNLDELVLAIRPVSLPSVLTPSEVATLRHKGRGN